MSRQIKLPTLRQSSSRLRSKTLTHAGGDARGSGPIPAIPDENEGWPEFPNDAILAWVRKNMFGVGVMVPGPFGSHPRRYFDYTASGLPFKPIEDLLAGQVLPWMSNTHSSASYGAEVIGAHVDAAHEKVRRAMRGTEDDVVVFTGSGATGAINKLIGILGIRMTEALQRHVDGEHSQIPLEERPIVILSRMEHHSNDLPWRESIADLEYVGYDDSGRANWRDIDQILSSAEYRDRRLKIGSFTAASNVTGVLNDTKQLAAAMHAHDGLAFFDFAAAGPYVPIDLHPDDDPRYQKDAVFLSVHKFSGGPQSPGLLVANKQVFKATPAEPGGGTVLYTSPWEYRYLDDPQAREEGGTAPIASIIRAGLAFDLKQGMREQLEHLEAHCVAAATTAWRDHPKIRILGPDPLTTPRLGILSLLLDNGELHYNLAVRLLNDLFGIQVRGGCMCAGTYGHDLLNISKAQSQSIRDALDDGQVTAKPGFVRVSFGPAVSREDLDVLLDAVPHVAERWREYALDYVLDPMTGEWRHERDVPNPSKLALQIPQTLTLFR